MPSRPAFLRALLLAFCCCLLGPAQAAEVALRFDFGQAHPFDGVGAQVFLNAPNPDEGARMLRDMNAQLVRVALLQKYPADKLGTGNLSLARAGEILTESETPALRRNLAEFKAMVDAQHLRVHLIVWHMPEAWEDVKQKKAASHKESHIARADRIPDYVNLVTAQLLFLRRAGLAIEAIELTNEPQGAWDLKYEPGDYADLVLQARRAMDAAGLQAIRIDGPGTGLRNFEAFLKGLQKRGALGALGFITAHAYQSPQKLADDATPGVAEFLGKGRFGPIVITEFGVKKHNGDDEEAADDLDVDSPAYALAASAEALQLLARGASSVIYWQLEDSARSKKLHGLISEDGRRRPVAAAVQALFGKVPGHGTLTAGQGGPALLPATAIKADGRLFLLLVNATDAPQQIVARFDGVTAPTSIGARSVWAAPGAGEPLAGASVSGGQFRATLAPRALASVELR